MNIKKYFRYIFIGESALFEIDCTIEEALEKLKKRVKKSVLQSDDGFYGNIEKDKIVINKFTPFISNSFYIYFIGAFEEINGKTYLKGSFRLIRLSLFLMAMWFFITGFMLYNTAGSCFESSGCNMGGIVFTLIFIFFGIFLLFFGMFLSRNNPKEISKMIQDTLK